MRRSSFICLKLLVALLLVWMAARPAAALTAIETIVQGIRNCQDSVNLQKFNIARTDMKDVWRETLDENPDLFYVVKSCRYSYNSAGIIVSVQLDYLFEKNIIPTLVSLFNARVDAIYEQLIEDDPDDFGYLLKTYDFLASHTAYTYAEDLVIPEGLPNAPGDIVYTSVGALVYRQAVCEGYSRTLKLLMNKRGIPCWILVSDSMKHAWNAVQINGKWYHADVTWGDPTCYGHYDLTQNPPQEVFHYTSYKDGNGNEVKVRTGEDFPGKVIHSFFLMTDEEFENHPIKTHENWGPALSTLGEPGGTFPGAFWAKENGNSLYNLAVKGNSAYYVEYDAVKKKRFLRKSTWSEEGTVTIDLREMSEGVWVTRTTNLGFVYVSSGILCFDQLLIFHDATTVYGYDMVDGDLFAIAHPGNREEKYYIYSIWKDWEGKIWTHLSWNGNYVGRVLELDELKNIYEKYQQMKRDGYQMASQTTAEPLVALNLNGTQLPVYFGSWLQNYHAVVTCPVDNRLAITVAPCEGAAANAGITLEVYAQEDAAMQNPLASANGSLADGVGLEYLVEANDASMASGESRSFVVRLSCEGQTSIVATQLSAQARERDFYAVEGVNCVADVDRAVEGKLVTVTATLPEGALVSDYDFAWNFAPAVDYTEGEGTASFAMPAEAVSVTCVAALKTYEVATGNCVADKSPAARGEAVTLTATLPEGALVSDYDFIWNFAPAVDYTEGEGTASFAMPAEAVSVTCVATLKTYEVAAEGCVADKSPAARGEAVTVTATLPEGALVSDYNYAWNFVPAVDYTEGEGVASFEMPAEAVSVTCVATLKTYAVATEGCVADKSPAARGEAVTVTATLPEGADASDYRITWRFYPEVEYSQDGATATFAMPDDALAVVAEIVRVYAITANSCTGGVERAAEGESVTLVADLPEGADLADYRITWRFSPEVAFAVDGATATFAMPAEAVEATADIVHLYAITVNSCTCDLERAAEGETVTLTAILPEGADIDAYVIQWTTEPEVALMKNGATATLTMPAEDITVTASVAHSPIRWNLSRAGIRWCLALRQMRRPQSGFRSSRP